MRLSAEPSLVGRDSVEPGTSLGCADDVFPPGSTESRPTEFCPFTLRGEVIGPKRSELSKNSGRAPIVKMSRMIPPTPVAAPWNGSIALG